MPIQDVSYANAALTLRQNPRLLCDLTQVSNDHLIAFLKSIQGVGNTNVLAKLHNHLLALPQIVSRYARIQVMHCLKLQSAMEEVQPSRTIDIHGGAQHSLWKGLRDAQVCCAHGEVGERDLNVDRRGDHVTDHDEDESVPGSWYRFVDCEIAEPVPEENLADNFKITVPPCWSLSRPLA